MKELYTNEEVAAYIATITSTFDKSNKIIIDVSEYARLKQIEEDYIELKFRVDGLDK